MAFGTEIRVGSCGFWCWHCDFHFTSPPDKDGFVHCIKCGEPVALADSPFWDRGTAWCAGCKFSYDIIEQRSKEPRCPRCNKLPTEHEHTEVDKKE